MGAHKHASMPGTRVRQARKYVSTQVRKHTKHVSTQASQARDLADSV